MHKIIVSSILISLSLFGAKVEKKAVSTPLVKEKIQPIQKTTIEGQGFLKTRGGDIKTCSGEVVYLYTSENFIKFIAEEDYRHAMADVKSYKRNLENYVEKKDDRYVGNFYVDSLIDSIRNMKSKYSEANLSDQFSVDIVNENIQKIIDYENKKLTSIGEKSKIFVETMCDASGNFIFKNVPFGSYGIVTKVTWERVEAGGRYTSPYTVTEGGKIGKIIDVNDNLQKVYITETIR